MAKGLHTSARGSTAQSLRKIFAPRVLRGGLMLLACSAFMTAANHALAVDSVAPEVLHEYLQAGEFAPALDLIRQVAPGPQRDALLVQVAKAQAAAGADGAAYSTLASVSDDRTRNAAVQSTRKTVPKQGSRGGSQANFGPLMDLITSTIKPTTWDEVGGAGSIAPFTNGVYVDADGVLRRVLKPQKAEGLAVARLDALKSEDNTDVRRSSPLRKVSLTRLEKQLQLHQAGGFPVSEDMLNLAGLEKIKYVLVYPETGDLVLAGPASSWRVDAEGRRVSRTSGRPILQLDDLVVVLRYLTAVPDGMFGCSINPSAEGLKRTKEFAEQSSSTPLKPGQRTAWLKKLREQMGRQSISVEGIDPRTRVARVLIEADYRMKLVGMGLEEGTRDTPSYLDLVDVPRGQAPPPLDVLRWWFTLNYDAVLATEDRDAFEIRGPGVRVLSENEMLTNLGQRVHSGQSEPLNQEFADRFTRHFAALAEKYPVYADLQNVFDLALVSALIRSQQLADRVDWHMTCFRDTDQYQVALGPAPQSVESVINHRVVNQKYVVVGVSGGVRVDPSALVKAESLKTDRYGALKAERTNDAAEALPADAWWWD